MTGNDFNDIRTGHAYESMRPALLSRLAAAAQLLRIELGQRLVLVFAPTETIRAALEEFARAERLGGDREKVAAHAVAFEALASGPSRLAATLYIDAADPVALGDRLVELPGVGECVFLEIAGERVGASRGVAADGSGAFHILFEPGEHVRQSLISGAGMTVGVEHPACHLRAALSAEQVAAVAADLRP